MKSIRLIDNVEDWVGGIPKGWNRVPLKRIAWKLNRPTRPDDPIVVCTNKGKAEYRGEKSPGLVSLTGNGYQGVLSEDLLIHGMDTWHGAIAVSDISGQCTSVVHVCDSNENKRFLSYYLRALSFRGVYKAFSNGVRQNTSDFRSWMKAGEIPVVLPSLEAQRRIANYLDEKCAQIDRAIEAAEGSIEEYKAYKESIVSRAVTKGLDKHVEMKDSGIEWLGWIPAHWSKTPIKRMFYISKTIAGKTGFDVLSITQRGLKVKDITSGEGQLAADYSNYQIVEPGDFAMNHMDLLTGWIDVSDRSGVTSPDYRVFKARRENIDKRYYLRVFQYYYFGRIFYGFCKGISSKGRWRLPADAFRNMQAPVPPLDEQRRIADYLDERCAQIDRAIAVKKSIIADLKAYKHSLIYEVVTGKREV